MQKSYLIQQSLFVLRFRYLKKLSSFFRKICYQMQGMKIGKGTHVPKIFTTWPHQIVIGKKCNLEHDIYFKYDGIWKKGPSIIIKDDVFIGSGCEFNIKARIDIGNNALIASGVRFVDHDHGMGLDILMNKQICSEERIMIEDNVWIGANAVILKGVKIESGAVVAAGAVVKKNIGSNEIWGGIPAIKIGIRK